MTQGGWSGLKRFLNEVWKERGEGTWVLYRWSRGRVKKEEKEKGEKKERIDDEIGMKLQKRRKMRRRKRREEKVNGDVAQW